MSYNHEQVRKARSTDLVAYLKKAGYQLKAEGTDSRGQQQYRVPDNGGLFVSGNHWYQKSTGDGGNTLDFLTSFLGFSFTAAMQELACTRELPSAVSLPPTLRVKKDLQLPKRANDNKRVIAYLTKTRGLPADIVVSLIREGLLYQDERGNCVFPCLHNGVAHGAILRGTLSDVQWRGSATGSDTAYPWHWPPATASDLVTVCESPIDAISLAVLRPGSRKGHIIALGGVHQDALESFLSRFNTTRVVLALDNDETGVEAISVSLKALQKAGIKTWVLVPKGKDWNEDLQTSC